MKVMLEISDRDFKEAIGEKKNDASLMNTLETNEKIENFRKEVGLLK